MYYYIEPEVNGSLGQKTTMDMTKHPPEIFQLYVDFDGWLGDDLLEIFPCFIVRASLGQKLLSGKLSGFKLQDIKVNKTDQFKELYPNKELPAFNWLQIDGEATNDDFGLTSDYRLVISKYALKILQVGSLNFADIEKII